MGPELWRRVHIVITCDFGKLYEINPIFISQVTTVMVVTHTVVIFDLVFSCLSNASMPTAYPFSPLVA